MLSLWVRFSDMHAPRRAGKRSPENNETQRMFGYSRLHNGFKPSHRQLGCNEHHRFIETHPRPVLNEFSIKAEGTQHNYQTQNQLFFQLSFMLI